ncbi:MAG: ATP-binding protein [Desulfatibacillum sp.]|nr:ATP-binding protein [Desulfatibacillum sp.]
MRIAIASGKGGTGKTTVAVALARVMDSCVLVDCDVEAPNAHLFLSPEVSHTQEAFVMIPVVDDDKCTGCGECSRVCQFNALAVLNKSVLVFEELCHGCGGCVIACEPKAITEGGRLIGTMQWGKANGMDFFDAKLRIGEPMSPPLIKGLKRQADLAEAENMILDCPPGTTCPMVEAVSGADYCILVTEPTPFGLHDLNMAAQAVRDMGIPSGVILNRAGMGDNCIQEYCRANGMTILMEIPHRREIAEGYAVGKDILRSMPELEDEFKNMIKTINEGLNNG